MCALGDVAEMIAKYAPLDMEQVDDSEIVMRFANGDHAGEFAQALAVLLHIRNGELE